MLQQAINYNHLMPTRYAVELDSLKGSLNNDTFKEQSQKEDAKKAIKKVFEQKYQAGTNKWLFQPLHVRTSFVPSADDSDVPMQF